MATNKSEGVIPAAEQAFKIESSESFDAIVKLGVHSMFKVYTEHKDKSTVQTKLEIGEALKLLADIDPNIKLEEDGEVSDSDQDIIVETKYFPSLHGGLVEFYRDRATSEFGVRVTDKDDDMKTNKPSTPEETKNQLFQMAVLSTINATDLSEVGRIILFGIFMIRSQMEARVGRFKDVFSQHHALFGKLRKVYERETVEELLKDEGEASAWFLVDEANARYERE